MQQLNPSEISNLIKEKIEKFEAKAEARNEGTVVALTDGIARIHGLTDVMQGEMIEFPGDTYGLALNLERDSVGAVIMGAYEHISEGDKVKCTGRILEVPVGTIVKNFETGEILADLVNNNDRFVLAKGGKGGREIFWG